jgi:alkanesulfonate monooxygenase SsuD/methylene tetrahydromethanopterin reductase-like flavin-dependent oxidoreductase (luciferase family)
MRLGINFGYQDWGNGLAGAVELAQSAERLGYHSVWTAEAYGTDAVTPGTWILANTEKISFGSAILQMPARTPAMTAMTAATLDMMSGGRFLLGLGLSGPQVVEGWHGQPYGKPLGKTREYVDIVRTILRREIPIYIGALGPRNVSLTAEIADGWLPIFVAPKRFDAVFGEDLERGFAVSGRRPGDGFDVAPVVSVVLGDDVDACRAPVKRRIALYIGGMGAAGQRNFSNNLIRRLGYADVADEVQRRFLGGEQERAVDAIPDELIDEVALCGPRERIAELLKAWEASPVTTLILASDDPAAMTVLAELPTWAAVL